MERSFNDNIIHSSNNDEKNSSEEKDDPFIFSPSKVCKEFRNIPEWSDFEEESAKINEVGTLIFPNLFLTSDQYFSCYLLKRKIISKQVISIICFKNRFYR